MYKIENRVYGSSNPAKLTTTVRTYSFAKNDPLENISIDNLLDPPPAPIVKPVDSVVVETVEAKATREAAEAAKVAEEKKASEIAIKYGGTKLDDKGNAVDATGKVVKTAEEILAAETPAPVAVTLDGVEYKLDKDGNAIDATGKTVKTKAELEAIEEAQNNVPLVNEIQQKIGIIPAKDGKPIEYEDSVDGIMQYVNDVAEIKRQQSEKDLFKAFPKAEAYIKHISRGGSDEEFFNVLQEDYSKVTIDETNVDQQKQIYKQLLIKRGFTPEKADKQVKLIADANQLLDESKDSLVTLQKMQKDAEKAKDLQYQQETEAQEKERTEHWTTVNEVVQSGKLNIKDGKGNITPIVIPEAIRKEFYAYISQSADEEGNSQAAIDRANLDLDTRLYIDLMQYLKYDMSKIVKDAVSTAKVKTLRERILKGKGQGVTVDNPTKVAGSAKDIDIDTLLG